MSARQIIKPNNQIASSPFRPPGPQPSANPPTRIPQQHTSPHPGPASAEAAARRTNRPPPPWTTRPSVLSSPAVSSSAYLSSPFPTASPGGEEEEEDRVGRLPDAILRNIVSRLPTKDAARTAALSSRWRHHWASTPLVLDGDGGAGGLAPAPAAAALASHPGPVRSARLAASRDPGAVASVLASLAAGGVEDLLVVLNGSCPAQWRVPSDVLGCAALGRLWIGLCQFPDTSGVAPALLSLRELGIVRSSVPDRDLHAVIPRCPVLETLAFALTQDYPRYVHIWSESLRCVVIWKSMLREVHLDDAPSVDRLLVEPIADATTHIKIIKAPKLKILGYFDVGLHQLKIGNTVIKIDTKVKPSAMVRTLRTLALKVQFGVEDQVKLVPTLLKCFPCLETLYITSVPSEAPDNVDIEFWDQVGFTECVYSHLKKLVLDAVRGEDSELAFAKFVMERAQMLEDMRVLVDGSCSRDVLLSCLSSEGCVSADATVVVERFDVTAWSFQRAIDLLLVAE
ncbi:F-box/FBD/LRR-repeat protein At1g13570-like isoform X2 [Panicum virgatum]|uniref:F-box/FBD/LRR-repeat protein At1g13570-like isoform X2 n=1 Tax=Panicum virgatum TaxID=38727 RepID=UPI0019D5276D|nr:F-box/FBD/LRR-repeat protein At1g13570-like isoform X2 [Panicum virgatum]